MRRSKYSESQIVFAIKQVETGTRIHEVTLEMVTNLFELSQSKSRLKEIEKIRAQKRKNLDREK